MVWKQNYSYSTFAWMSRATWLSTVILKQMRPDSQGQLYVSSFNVHCVCQWGGVSGLRRVVDEFQRTKPRRPWTKFAPEQNTEIWKQAAKLAVAASMNTNCACGCQKWVWLMGILDP